MLVMAREEPVEQRGAGAADMQKPGRRGGKTDDDAHTYLYHTGALTFRRFCRPLPLDDRRYAALRLRQWASARALLPDGFFGGAAKRGGGATVAARPACR